MLLQLVWFYAAKRIEPYIAEALHVKPICHVISILTPSVPVSQNGMNIVSSNFSLSVDSACNGLDAILLVVSAVIAFRSNILKKIAGIIFSGKGYGHGVGLSQNAAKHMAEMGYSYQSILKFYYRGVCIGRMNSVLYAGRDNPYRKKEIYQ